MGCGEGSSGLRREWPHCEGTAEPSQGVRHGGVGPDGFGGSEQVREVRREVSAGSST